MEQEREHPTLERSKVTCDWRGPMKVARAWRSWREPDTKRENVVRDAVGWTVLAANTTFQVLVTCAYWRDDAGWWCPSGST